MRGTQKEKKKIDFFFSGGEGSYLFKKMTFPFAERQFVTDHRKIPCFSFVSCGILSKGNWTWVE